MVAPATPLLPASAAATPSISPLPNASGFFEDRRASLYDINAAGAPPMPGMAPSTTPITLPLTIVRKHFFTSSKDAPTPESSLLMAVEDFMKKKLTISGRAKSPIKTGINVKPLIKLTCPKTNLSVP